jgi:hypothetical protein
MSSSVKGRPERLEALLPGSVPDLKVSDLTHTQKKRHIRRVDENSTRAISLERCPEAEGSDQMNSFKPVNATDVNTMTYSIVNDK